MLGTSVSVVVPTYNRGPVVMRALSSVIGQSYRDFDLWIVDDGSTDDTEFRVHAFTRGLSPNVAARIHYMKTENRGVSTARNMGARASRSDWIAFLDSDDEWLPAKLALSIKAVEKQPEIRLVHTEEIWIRNGVRVNPKKSYQKTGGRIYRKCLPCCVISPSTVTIRRDLFEEMGGFDEGFPVCEDYDLWLKITSLYPVGFVDEPTTIKYGGHDDQLSLTHRAMDYWRIKAMVRILRECDLEPGDRDLTIAEIRSKGEILLKGYRKHHNLERYREIETILNSLGIFPRK